MTHHTYTWVKSYGHFNMPRAFVLNFEHLDILCARIGHLSEKLWSFEFLYRFFCSISSDWIYYWTKSDFWVKSYGRFKLARASMFNFEHLAILFAWITHLSEKLWAYEFAESFRCSISCDSICYWYKSDIRVKSYGRLNFPCASMFNFKHLDILCAWIGPPS